MSTPFVQGFVEAQAPSGRPAWLAERGRAAIDAFSHAGLGAARAERWKYTALRAFEKRRFEPAVADAEPGLAEASLALAGLEGPRLVFVDGRLHAGLSRLPAPVEGVRFGSLGAQLEQLGEGALRPLCVASEREDDVFARLGLAFASDGALVEVDAGVDPGTTLHLVFAGSAGQRDRAWHLANRFVLGDGARLRLVEHHLDGENNAGLGNLFSSIELGAGAVLEHLRLQQSGSEALRFARSEVAVGAGASYHGVALELGAATSRHELALSLDGVGAQARLRGLGLAGGRQRIDTRLEIRHAVGGTTSDTLWRSVADGRSRVALGGAIAIAAGADGSDAALATRGLLLAEGAEIDSQPVLEIDTDEVKASHGAAIGQLDPMSLFYLRTRGIPLERARALLTRAFCAEVIDAWPEAPLREALGEVVDARLADAGQGG